MSIYKIFKIIALILGVIGCIFLGIVITKGDAAVTATGEGVDGFLYTSYVTMFIILAAVVVFFIVDLISGKFKKNFFIGFGAFIAVIVISYILADGTPMQLREGDSLSGSGVKWVETGLYTFYILAVVAIVSMILSGIRKVTK
ncbi:MAG TPA: hypothetical protein VFF21_05650 [Flavobacteriaceae bacterium]|nr:hypothetical protein [Flavobacteriaceae bacterium]